MDKFFDYILFKNNITRGVIIYGLMIIFFIYRGVKNLMEKGIKI